MPSQKMSIMQGLKQYREDIQAKDIYFVNETAEYFRKKTEMLFSDTISKHYLIDTRWNSTGKKITSSITH